MVRIGFLEGVILNRGKHMLDQYMKRSVVFCLFLVVVSLAGASDGLSLSPDALADRAAADVASPVRVGGVNGQPFWNRRSLHFMHPPAFAFLSVSNAVTYRFTVFDDKLNRHVFTNQNATADLSPVWKALQPGFVCVQVDALDNAGKIAGTCGTRRFWKLAPYEPGAYPPKPYSYMECVKRYYPTLFAHTNTQHFLAHGRPDGYSDLQNIYPAKMNSSLVLGMLRYAKLEPANREAALDVARKAADYTLSISQDGQAPLAHFPPTYWKMKGQKSDFASQRYAGQNMLVYPAHMGCAYLALYSEIGDEKYLTAALGIAATFEKLQLPDGTWYLKLWEKDAGPVIDKVSHQAVKMTPTPVCVFLEDLARVTGNERWRAIADKAFKYIQEGPLRTYDFGPQFEDTRPSVNYRDLTSCVPMEIALYMMKRFPNDSQRMAQVRELLRWVEDQFVCWRKPCRADNHGILSEACHGFNPVWCSIEDACGAPGTRFFGNWVDVPGVMEKYRWSIMVNGVVGLAMRAYLEYYRISHDELALAKAKTLGDSIVRVQAMGPDGEIATHWDVRDVAKGVGCLQNWTNCGVSAVLHLEELAREVELE